MPSVVRLNISLPILLKNRIIFTQTVFDIPSDRENQKKTLATRLFDEQCKGLKWWAQLGSNQRPDDYESSALTD